MLVWQAFWEAEGRCIAPFGVAARIIAKQFNFFFFSFSSVSQETVIPSHQIDWVILAS
jgi:hypothetical protein